jgi:molybdopterin converting factor small subunit
MAQMLLVNGVQAPRDPAARAALRLAAGDSVAIFPPVAGG